MKLKLATILTAAALFYVGSLTGSAQTFSVSGDTFSVNPGFPWTGSTNYRFTITTDGVNGLFDAPNQGDGGLDGTPFSLNIANGEWLDVQGQTYTLSGSIASMPTGNQSYLQIGMITREQAERSADWYASGMFNNSVFGTFWGDSMSVGDTGGSSTVVATGLTGPFDYDIEIDFAAETVRGRVNNGAWSSAQSFGTDNWDWAGYEEAGDWAESAFLANMYIEDTSTDSASSVSYNAVTVVPEPAVGSLLLVGLGALALRRRRNRR